MITHLIQQTRRKMKSLIFISLSLHMSANSRSSTARNRRMKFNLSIPQLNKEPLNRTPGFHVNIIDFIICIAFITPLSALNKIHAKSTNTKVVKILSSLPGSDPPLRCSICDAFRRTGSRTSPIIWYRPLRPPQITNVKSAPCHNPLIRKTISLFKYFLNLPFLFPPRGIYR